MLVGIRNRHILLLILVMAAIAVTVSGVAITMLYHTATQQQAMRLSETTQSQARFLEAVARFDARFSREDVPGGAFAATLQQIREAHELFKGFGSTGEFTLAKQDGAQMIFLLAQRTESAGNAGNSLVVPIDGKLAEPMRQALAGHSGTVIGLDYRGVKVLAAYEPVAELNLGIVAKIDLAEVRQPFFQAGLLVILVTFVLVVIGTFFVRSIGNPLVNRLQENEQRLRGILDTAADGIITLDEKGIIHSFNQSAEQIFGYRANEVIGQDIDALILEPFPYPALPSSVEHVPHPKGAEREITGLHRSGEKVPLEITVSEVRDQHSRIITSIVRNISERKEALMALHQREEELRLTFENAPAGIYVSSLSGQILRANHAFCSLLNFTGEELLGRSHIDFIDSNDRGRLRIFERQLVNGGLDSYSLDISLIERNGERVPCKLRSSVILNEQKSPQLCIVHIEDLSEHLKNEQLVSEHRERLAQVTRLSTLGEMAASIAHEINQPLSAIATYATACQNMTNQPEPDYQEVSKTLVKIRNQALRAGDVIHRLREFVRNRTTQREQVSCEKLINDVLGLAEVDAHFHQVLISTDIESQLPSIEVDVVQIQQVILNLLRNAIEAMEQVQENRLVRVAVKRLGADFIEIAVIDRGAGLPEASATELFTPFFTSKPMGLGLGLPISRSIVNAHGGQLDYTHNPEGGSIFKFTLSIKG